MSIRADADTDRNVTGAQLALVLGGLVVVVVLLWFFFLRGGGGSTEQQAIVPEPTATEAPIESPESEPTPEPGPGKTREGRRRGPVETFEVFAPKDPFQPLILANALGGTAGQTTTDGTTTGGTTTTVGGETTTGTTTTVVSGPGSGEARTIRGSQGGSGVSGHRITLIDVYETAGAARARVEVDGTVYTVSPGETFAASFKLLSTSGRCASMLFGDDQFSICEGEEILK